MGEGQSNRWGSLQPLKKKTTHLFSGSILQREVNDLFPKSEPDKLPAYLLKLLALSVLKEHAKENDTQ